MRYFEHYLAAGGVRQLGRVSILRSTDERWVYDTLRDEIGDVFPSATITVDAESAVPSPVDLLVVPVMTPYAFPFHDVVYLQLDVLKRETRHQARHVMIYRARWREVEVVAAADLPALLRRRRWEARLIHACTQFTLLRRVLRPRYPN